MELSQDGFVASSLCERESRTLNDEDYMRAALALAKRGAGWANPNPMVGCIIVRDGEVIGMGYHAKFGELHAERVALADVARRGLSAKDASVYVTLEPCAHHGKTPPCTDALIEAEVTRVIIGSRDPNPLVAGKGIELLRDAGIEVDCDVLKDDCDALNAPFFHYIETGRPYVIAKYASTLDGKVATHTGASKWITGDVARRRVHADRARYSAIMVGVSTVIADDPQLNSRIQWDAYDGIDVLGKLFDGEVVRSDLGIHQPIRVILDTNLKCPIDANVVLTAKDQPTMIATCVDDETRLCAYKDMGCTVILAKKDDSGRIDLNDLFDTLGKMGIDSVYVEGGSTVLGSLFDLHLADRLDAYIAPKVFGGKCAPSAVGGVGVGLPCVAAHLSSVSLEPLGEDFLLSGNLVWGEQV